MRKFIGIALLLSAGFANAGIARLGYRYAVKPSAKVVAKSSKVVAKAPKAAAKAGVKTAKVAGKVLY